MPFQLKANFSPAGDQPNAIEQLAAGTTKGFKHQTLLGVTGSGKTYTMANVIAKIQKPTLVIAHNKTLAAQLCQEYRSFFPESAVEYFVSYYDYYQPEAYIPSSDTYIEKEAMINEEIDRLRHSATQSVLTRDDVIVVASVSAIYNIGSPESYENSALRLWAGQTLSRETIIAQLVQLQFDRNDITHERGAFRVRGGIIEIIPADREIIYRVILEGDIVLGLQEVHPVNRSVLRDRQSLTVYPARHYVTEKAYVEQALLAIEEEMKQQVEKFMAQGNLIEAERLKRRTMYDLEMIREVGYCNGIENYSRYFDGRNPGQAPHTLLHYFVRSTKNWLLVIDESHVTVPQIRGMYEGDRSRKQTLIEHGFRLPSALDNRPLQFHEFESIVNQVIYTSATPGEYELVHSHIASGCDVISTLNAMPDGRQEGAGKKSSQKNPNDQNDRGLEKSNFSHNCVGIVEQIVRPTGLIDPEIIIQPSNGQIDDLEKRIKGRSQKSERTLVTTLTKRMAEDLSQYLKEKGHKVHYLHSEVDTLERIETLTNLRQGVYDVLVGVNLLREGLDLPEVSLVAILDADKEGFLRSQTSLIQTMGRAARHVYGQVVMYADMITGSIDRAIQESSRRRQIQLKYNKQHNITPRSIKKSVQDITEQILSRKKTKDVKGLIRLEQLNTEKFKVGDLINQKEKEMKQAAQNLEFELAAILRDEITELKKVAKNA